MIHKFHVNLDICISFQNCHCKNVFQDFPYYWTTFLFAVKYFYLRECNIWNQTHNFDYCLGTQGHISSLYLVHQLCLSSASIPPKLYQRTKTHIYSFFHNSPDSHCCQCFSAGPLCCSHNRRYHHPSMQVVLMLMSMLHLFSY